jgi:hypothetical protein
MKTGTCHFPTIYAAREYYRPYGFGPADVSRKLADGEIKLGPPPLLPGQRATIYENRFLSKSNPQPDTRTP